MKKILVLSLILGLSNMSFAASATSKGEKAICQKLSDQADSDCADLMCKDMITGSDFSSMEECLSAPDYAEAAQGACEDVLPDLISQFNKQHPRQTVTCDE